MAAIVTCAATEYTQTTLFEAEDIDRSGNEMIGSSDNRNLADPAVVVVAMHLAPHAGTAFS